MVPQTLLLNVVEDVDMTGRKGEAAHRTLTFLAVQ